MSHDSVSSVNPLLTVRLTYLSRCSKSATFLLVGHLQCCDRMATAKRMSMRTLTAAYIKDMTDATYLFCCAVSAFTELSMLIKSPLIGYSSCPVTLLSLTYLTRYVSMFICIILSGLCHMSMPRNVKLPSWIVHLCFSKNSLTLSLSFLVVNEHRQSSTCIFTALLVIGCMNRQGSI